MIGYDAFKSRLGGRPSWLSAAAVAAITVLVLGTADVAAWVVCGLVAGIVVTLCAARTLRPAPATAQATT